MDNVKKKEAILKIKVSNREKAPESLEELTDDVVFKELVNIVVDVFSSKSENCIVSFEVPEQAHPVNTPSHSYECTQNTYSLCNRSETSRSKSEISVPTKLSEIALFDKGSNKSKNLRNLILKTTKYNKRNKINKKLNPVILTVLNAKRERTNLESFVKLYDQSGKISKTRKMNSWTTKPITDENVAKVPKRFSKHRKTLLLETSNLSLGKRRPVLTKNNNSCTESNPSLKNELLTVLESLRKLSCLSYNGSSTTFIKSNYPEKIAFHVKEIKNHVDAINCYVLKSSKRYAFSSHNKYLKFPVKRRNNDVSSTSEDLGGKNPTHNTRRDIECFRAIRSCHNRKRKYSKLISKLRRAQLENKHEGDLSTEEVLRYYQNLKRKETGLVNVLLNQLGVNNDEREHSHFCLKSSLRNCYASCNKFVAIPDRDFSPESSDRKQENLQFGNLKPASCDVSHGSGKFTKRSHSEGELKLNNVMNNCQTRLLRRSYINEKKRDRLLLNKKIHSLKRCSKFQIDIVEESSELYNGKDKKDKYPNTLSQNIKCEMEKSIFNVHQNRLEECTSGTGEEEKVMARLHEAAGDLEEIQELVEKKLNFLCQKKELFKEMESKILKYQADQGKVSKSEVDHTGDEFNQKEHDPQNVKGRSEQFPKFLGLDSFEEYDCPEVENFSIMESKHFKMLNGLEAPETYLSEHQNTTATSELERSENVATEENPTPDKNYICNFLELTNCEFKNDGSNTSKRGYLTLDSSNHESFDTVFRKDSMKSLESLDHLDCEHEATIFDSNDGAAVKKHFLSPAVPEEIKDRESECEKDRKIRREMTFSENVNNFQYDRNFKLNQEENIVWHHIKD